MVKLKRLREAGHVARMVKNRNAYRLLVAKREGQVDHFGGLGTLERILLKLMYRGGVVLW
jgi:hypothetical protein